jgi:hypothetical protein
MDFLLAGTLFSFYLWSFKAGSLSSVRCTSCCSTVENIPFQAERHSGGQQKLCAFPPESAFTFRPECCSKSQRNRVHLQTGMLFGITTESAFTFDRIPHNRGSLIDMDFFHSDRV